MNGPFCATTAKTNEEYRIVLKKRNVIFILLMVFGLITAILGLVAKNYMDTHIDERMLGMYTGFGTGLFIAGAIFLIKNLLLLKNDEKLKESRLKFTDERNLQIESKAFRAATYVLVAVLYLVTMIGGIIYPPLIYALLIIMASFLVAYIIALRVYNSKM